VYAAYNGNFTGTWSVSEIMKRIAAFLILVMAMSILAGCKNKDKETNFVPTPIPEDYTQEYTDIPGEDEILEYNPDDSEASTGEGDKEPVYVGKTIEKYVKLNSYGSTLRIRNKPSVDSDIVGHLVHTEKINVIEIKDGWASFVYHDEICYVSADYLVDRKPAYLSPPTPTPAPEPTSGSSGN
jgi:uncharacterized protein YgiM (DUF1202 family)